MQRNRKKRIVVWILGIIITLIVAVIVFFQIPYSPLSHEFQSAVQSHTNQSNVPAGIFTEQDLEHLPEPIQNHFRITGLIGHPVMSSVSICIPSAHIYTSSDSTPMVLNYTLYLFGHRPVRLAYMNTSMFGVPFEALDSFQYGVGFMRGELGKTFTIFNETGIEMDRAQLLTYLGELFLIPSAMLSEHIIWETIDERNVKATIIYDDLQGSGIFTFNDDGFLHSFRTDERGRVNTDGSIDFLAWSAVIEYWLKDERGIYLPGNMIAVWHEPEGDFIYFYPTEGFNITFH